MLSLVQNLQIGTKLAVASALAVLLVASMIASQMFGNASLRQSNKNVLTQQEIARDAVEAKVAVRGMQLAVRDVRLAGNASDLQKAGETMAERQRSITTLADSMLKLSHSVENRARIEKLKTLAADYAKGAQQISAARSAAFSAGTTESGARLAEINEEAVRRAREVTLPIASELDVLTNQIAEFAKHKSEQEYAEAEQELATAERLATMVGLCTVFVLIGSWLVSFLAIARPIRALTVAMDKLAGGDFSVVLPGLGRKDEVGGVAAAVEKFKVVSEQKARQEAEVKIRQDQLAAEQRKAEMRKLADGFEAAIGEIVDTVSSAATELEASASTLTSTAARGQELTTMVAAASEEASTNVQSVASATEELSSSITEISCQVQESARVAREAVNQARTTTDRVGELSVAAARMATWSS